MQPSKRQLQMTMRIVMHVRYNIELTIVSWLWTSCDERALPSSVCADFVHYWLHEIRETFNASIDNNKLEP